MAHAKLLTLTSAGRSYPFAFDGTARSQLWVGDSLSGEPTHALASLEADNGDLVLSPARGCLLSTASGETIEKATLPPEGEAVFSIASPRLAVPAILYACDATEGARTYRKLGFAYDAELLIGRDESAAFSYRSRFVSSQHARLSLTGDTLSICDLGSGNGTFVNGCALTPHEPRVLAPGDVVQVLDLVLMAGRRLVALNTPDALVIGEIPGAAWIDHEARVILSRAQTRSFGASSCVPGGRPAHAEKTG